MSDKPVFISYGDNCMIEKLKERGNTIMGKVLHCSRSDLNFGDIVLYDEYDSNQMDIGNDKKADVVWCAKIRCIIRKEG